MKRNSKENSSGGFEAERQISSIFNSIVSNLPQNLVAQRVKPNKGSTLCRGLIKIYKKEAWEKERDDKRNASRPIETYAFYIKNFQDSTLESIAIYGNDVSTKYYMIRRRGVLFGYRVASVKVETGLRPFLDVKLAV